jgi:hypothetical protein
MEQNITVQSPNNIGTKEIITTEELKQRYGIQESIKIEEDNNQLLETFGTIGLIVGIILFLLLLVFIVFPYLLGIAVRIFKKASK